MRKFKFEFVRSKQTAGQVFLTPEDFEAQQQNIRGLASMWPKNRQGHSKRVAIFESHHIATHRLAIRSILYGILS